MDVLMIIFLLQYFSLLTHVTPYRSSKEETNGSFQSTIRIYTYRNHWDYEDTDLFVSNNSSPNFCKTSGWSKEQRSFFYYHYYVFSVIFNWDNLELMKWSVLGLKFLSVWRSGKIYFSICFPLFSSSKSLCGN